MIILHEDDIKPPDKNLLRRIIWHMVSVWILRAVLLFGTIHLYNPDHLRPSLIFGWILLETFIVL